MREDTVLGRHASIAPRTARPRRSGSAPDRRAQETCADTEAVFQNHLPRRSDQGLLVTLKYTRSRLSRSSTRPSAGPSPRDSAGCSAASRAETGAQVCIVCDQCAKACPTI